MAIVGSVFALVGRFAGRLLNSALGWATLLLFGKVQGRKQTLLLVIALGSLLWVALIVGVLLPDVGVFLLAFVPLPSFVDENLVRLGMLALALLIPLSIGVVAVLVSEPATRPKDVGLLANVLRGYPFTLVLAATIVILAAVSLVRKVRSLTKRWDDAHVPVIVKPGGYERVLDDLEHVLGRAGFDIVRADAPGVLSAPPRFLDAIAGRALGGLVPDHLMMIKAQDLEVLVYPSDVAISGTRSAVAIARAAIADQLTDSPAYLTASAESERVEDQLRAIAATAAQGADIADAVARVRALDDSIAKLTVPFDEWETVYRERLQVERDLLRRAGSAKGHAGGSNGPRAADVAPDDAGPGPALWGLAAIGMALLAADVVLLLIEQRQPGNRNRN